MGMSVQNQQEEGREDTFSPEYVEQHLERIKLLERTDGGKKIGW